MKTSLIFTFVILGSNIAMAGPKLSKILPGTWISETYSSIYTENGQLRKDHTIYYKVRTAEEESSLSSCSDEEIEQKLTLLKLKAIESKKDLVYSAVDTLFFNNIKVEGYTEYIFSVEGQESLSCSQLIYSSAIPVNQDNFIIGLGVGNSKLKVDIISKKRIRLNF